MIRHPLLFTVFTVDLLSLLLLMWAAVVAFQIAIHWHPQDTGPKQLRLQARSETAALATTWVFGLQLFATAVLVFALTNILPDMVPGAMCGTGVLQAMESGGPRMLIFRLTALVVFWVWRRVENVNQSLPEAPLVPVNARFILLALPVFGLALHACGQAVMALELQQPVDCCAVIYDQFQDAGAARRTMRIPNQAWMAMFGGASVFLVAAALAAWRRPAYRGRNILLASAALLWLPVSAIALVAGLAAYHYGVLHHHCPWCLFLPEHRLIGFPIWVSWIVVAYETTASLVLSAIAAGQPPSATAMARKVAGKAAGNVLLAALLFVLLTAGPALWWRLHFGMWLGG